MGSSRNRLPRLDLSQDGHRQKLSTLTRPTALFPTLFLHLILIRFQNKVWVFQAPPPSCVEVRDGHA